jgi:hypothetical protein
MAKLKLVPNPTFSAPVLIPVHGSAPVPVTFTFKHRSQTELQSYIRDLAADRPDIDVIKDVASAWELDDEFTDENIGRLLDNYGGANKAVWDTYLSVLAGERAKN